MTPAPEMVSSTSSDHLSPNRETMLRMGHVAKYSGVNSVVSIKINKKYIVTICKSTIPSKKEPELHLALAEGDKVLCVSEGKFGVAPGEHVAFYDIFRFENGKIVEHWDNIQTIPADGEWANPNGKFGF